MILELWDSNNGRKETRMIDIFYNRQPTIIVEKYATEFINDLINELIDKGEWTELMLEVYNILTIEEAEELIEKTKKALEGEDLEEIKKAKDNLLSKANELATKVYEEAAKNNQSEETTTAEEDKNSNDDVVDAEYEEK